MSIATAANTKEIKQLQGQNGMITVEAANWKGLRIYFKDSFGGNACWDLVKKEWITVHKQVGPGFRERLAEEFGLI